MPGGLCEPIKFYADSFFVASLIKQLQKRRAFLLWRGDTSPLTQFQSGIGLPRYVQDAHPGSSLHICSSFIILRQFISGRTAFHRSPQTLCICQRRSAPDICDSISVIPDSPHTIPFLACDRLCAIQREIRPICRLAKRRTVIRHFPDRLARRPIPQPVCRQVFPCGGIFDFTRLVCFTQWQTASLPLGPQPVFDRKRLPIPRIEKKFSAI